MPYIITAFLAFLAGAACYRLYFTKLKVWTASELDKLRAKF